MGERAYSGARGADAEGRYQKLDRTYGNVSRCAAGRRLRYLRSTVIAARRLEYSPPISLNGRAWWRWGGCAWRLRGGVGGGGIFSTDTDVLKIREKVAFGTSIATSFFNLSLVAGGA